MEHPSCKSIFSPIRKEIAIFNSCTCLPKEHDIDRIIPMCKVLPIKEKQHFQMKPAEHVNFEFMRDFVRKAKFSSRRSGKRFFECFEDWFEAEIQAMENGY